MFFGFKILRMEMKAIQPKQTKLWSIDGHLGEYFKREFKNCKYGSY